MKHTTVAKLLAGGAACALALSTAFAQVEGAPTTTTTTTAGSTGVSSSTTTSTTNGTGTITAYTPGSDLHHVSHRDERGSGEVLLHQEHDAGGSGRSHR